ncbi:unnamed protein product [Sympodiomycopsis kandeliae]
MEAHSLNAWTRFALQKGGIGSCTALVDNPATEPEDLMFMTGEKIIVLRRMEADELPQGTSTFKHKNGLTDEDSWFLGYCEGVVGRFRGSHVKIHGKLKKPILMRRSGQGQIRESSTKFMSQAAAASLPESQVPIGIPVTAVDSDGEEGAPGSRNRSRRGSGATSDIADAGSRASTTHSIDVPPRLPPSPNLSVPIPSPAGDQLSKTPTQASTSLSAAQQSSRGKSRPTSDPYDSDDSETLLPWARPMSKPSSPEGRAVAESSSAAPSGNQKGSSSHSSPGESSDAHPSSSKLPMSPSQDSTASSITDESEDEGSSTNHRRDYTFSIYDVYGRDSVAFPNFNLRHLSKALAESNSSLSSAHPSPPIPDGFKSSSPHESRSDIVPSTQQDVPQRLLYSPSGRRPNAAPDPRAPPNTGRAMASNLRQQVEATSSPRTEMPPPMSATSEESSPVTPQDMSRFPHYGPDSYDPRRRPSGPPTTLPQLRIPNRGAQSSPSSPHAPQGVPRPGQPMPSGFTPPAGAQNAAVHLHQPQPMHQPMAYDAQGVVSPNENAASPTGSYFPMGINPNSSALKPVRASSDRSSERERVGSGQLRKNPSNPSPGSYGGGPGTMRRSVGALSPPPGPNGAISRTPSPRSHGDGASPGSAGPPTPTGTARQPSPANGSRSQGSGSVVPSPTATVGGTLPQPHKYDAKGFMLGPGPPCRPDAEDREVLEKWNQILAENDLASAKKSRKVRKLVQAGIPGSIRGKVWLFLANAGVRRRPGLFEKLCKTSQEPKGKKGKEALYESIEKDVGRTFPDNKYFGDGRPGRADLDAILKAYAHYNPIIGYTQGMGMLAGIFLLHMPPEDAFWMLCATLRDIHMEGYYSNDMKQMHIDGVIFGQLLQTMDRPLADKLQSLQVEPIQFTPNWFLPLFCRILPWSTLFPVWDIFLFEGPNWILQVALAIVRIIRDPLMAARGPDAREECVRLLLHPPPRELTTANVLTSALSVKLKEGEVRKLSRSASKLVRESGAAGGSSAIRR